MCEHKDFEADVQVNRIEDVRRFSVDLQVRCIECSTLFQFVGLPDGVNINYPTRSIDGTEARMPIVPFGEEPTLVDGITGFNVKRVQ